MFPDAYLSKYHLHKLDAYSTIDLKTLQLSALKAVDNITHEKCWLDHASQRTPPNKHSEQSMSHERGSKMGKPKALILVVRAVLGCSHFC